MSTPPSSTPPSTTAPVLATRTARRRGPNSEAAPEVEAQRPVPPPAPAAPARPAPQAAERPSPAPQAAAPTRPAPPAAERPSLDGDALLAELASFDAADMASLLGQAGPVRFEAGDEVEGRVVRISRDTVFVDIGAKSEAWIALTELASPPSPGEPLRARVMEAGAAGIRLTRTLSGSSGLDAIETAKETGLPIEGRVEARNTGGFVIAMGGLRGFCPVSHIDRHPGTDLDAWIGRTLLFRVIDLRGKDIVLSHRAIAEEQAREGAAALWAGLKAGQEREGVVTGVAAFGCFVDLGGVSGLVHKSELSWADDAAAPVVGSTVTVRVIEVDSVAGRLSLSLRDPGMDPWSRVGSDIVEGEVYTGIVSRLADFGAFIELLPGLQGLAHISTLADRRIGHPSEVLTPGQSVPVKVLSVDRERSRIELSLVRDGTEERAPSAAAQRRPAATQGSLGTFADLLGGLKLKR